MPQQLVARLTLAFQNIGVDIKTILANEGNLTALTTTAKTNLVAAINEVQAALATAGINDAAPSSSTTKTYSANKITTLIAQVKSDILNGADAAHDTLVELQNLMTNDETNITALLTAVGNRVRFDASQSLTTAQQLQARQNIDAFGTPEIGNPDTDFVAVYTTAKT